MHVFASFSEYESAGHPRPCRFVCSSCRQQIGLPEIPGGTGAAGYALTGERPNMQMVCYPCADTSQRRELLDRSRPFMAYLSGDGRNVTTWTGGNLGDVLRESSARNGFYGSQITYVRVRDIHGALWYGRGPGRGMYVKLRAMKG